MARCVMKRRTRLREDEMREQPKRYQYVYTRDEFIFACWLSGIAGVLITVLGAYLWSVH